MWGFNGVEHKKTENGVAFHGEQALIDDTWLSGEISVDSHPFVEHYKFVKALEDENTVAKQTIPAPAQFSSSSSFLQILKRQGSSIRQMKNLSTILRTDTKR